MANVTSFTFQKLIFTLLNIFKNAQIEHIKEPNLKNERNENQSSLQQCRLTCFNGILQQMEVRARVWRRDMEGGLVVVEL